jgi:hypothetical protein
VSITPAGRRLVEFTCHTALLALILHPLLLIIFRLMIFSTFPRDDYAPMLLWWLGEGGGAAPQSPYGYRVLSVLAAAPFYYLLPPFTLTNLPAGLGAEYVRATAALAASSFVAIAAGAALAYRLAVDRFGFGRAEGMFAGLFVTVVQLYAAPFSIDPHAILVVTLALYFVDRVLVFAAILIAAAIVNEKVAIVFAVWLTIRCALGDRALLGRQWVASMVAILAYAGLLAAVRMPGHGEQLDPSAYLPTVWQNIAASVTPRGLMFNIVPCALLAGAVAWSWRALDWQRGRNYSPFDLLTIPALAGVALALTQFYQVGRVVAHAAPLFIWPLAQQHASWARRPRI